MGIMDISSYKSLWRGYEYFKDKKVRKVHEMSPQVFNAEVLNAEYDVYHVQLNIKHPRKSTCTCPYASGRMIICKHKIAVFFTVFPDEAKAYMQEVEAYEKEEEKRYQAHLKYMEEQYQEVKKYVNQLTLEELRERLIEYMLSETNHEDDAFFDF